jgi:uncharacterized protein DUF2510
MNTALDTRARRTQRQVPSLRLAVVVMAIGGALGVFSAVKVIVPVVDAISSADTFDTPGVGRLHLDGGDYTVFEHTGTQRGGGVVTVTEDNSVTIDSTAVTVTDSTGKNIRVDDESPNQTYTQGSRIYTAAVGFSAPAGGDYDIKVDTPQPNQVLVSRSLSDTLRSVALWLVSGGVSVLVFGAGLVLLIVGIVRRGRARRVTPVPATPPATPSMPPAGWYPDPKAPGRKRYWDGGRWTDVH